MVRIIRDRDVQRRYICDDESIEQVEMTSCGLNEGPLIGTGKYPATICCNLTNGKMPHLSNKRAANIPMVTHQGDVRFVGNATKGTIIVYKYFDLSMTDKISIAARGTGTIELMINSVIIDNLSYSSNEWQSQSVDITRKDNNAAIELLIKSGCLDILELEMSCL